MWWPEVVIVGGGLGGFYTALTPEGARSVHSGRIIPVTDANFRLAWGQLVQPFAPAAAGGG